MKLATPPTKNFHLPLPSDTYDELRKAAERLGEPATAVARAAISEWLERQKQCAIEQRIAEYAAAVGGSQDDLDRGLERAGLETIASDTGRRRRR